MIRKINRVALLVALAATPAVAQTTPIPTPSSPSTQAAKPPPDAAVVSPLGPLPARLQTARPTAFADIGAGTAVIEDARCGAASRPPSLPGVHLSAVPGPDFPTPQDAATALLSALLSDDTWQLDAVIGPGAAGLLRSGDHVVDKEDQRQFILDYADRHRIDTPAPGHAVLVIGPHDWPFPIQMAEGPGGWHFDTLSAAMEIQDRRIGRNERGAIHALAAIVTAQTRYHDMDDGPHTYAARIFSTAKQHDGLYWTAPPESPLAKLVMTAQAEGYALAPADLAGSFAGYQLRLLPSAKGQSFLVKGRLESGFAYIAWPTRYGQTGVMTFLVGPDGQVRQRDLGAHTTELAATVHDFAPDAFWTPAQQAGPQP